MLDFEPDVHRLSYDDVLRMFETGILPEDARVELLDGVLYDVKSETPEHAGTVVWLSRQLMLAAAELEVRVQSTFLVEGGFVSPDLLVTDPIPLRDHLPDTAHLAVEVAVTSQRHDHVKARRYARAGVGELWIVDYPARTVFVERGPGTNGYAAVERLGDGDRLALPFAGAALDVAELLGPAR